MEGGGPGTKWCNPFGWPSCRSARSWPGSAPPWQRCWAGQPGWILDWGILLRLNMDRLGNIKVCWMLLVWRAKEVRHQGMMWGGYNTQRFLGWRRNGWRRVNHLYFMNGLRGRSVRLRRSLDENGRDRRFRLEAGWCWNRRSCIGSGFGSRGMEDGRRCMMLWMRGGRWNVGCLWWRMFWFRMRWRRGW